MNNCTQYHFKNCIVFILFFSVIACSKKQNISFSETVRMSLREVGHHLLLANQDSTTLVKPVVTLGILKYQLSFEEQLIIRPDSLITYIENSFKKESLPQSYLVEVVQCENEEVAYSYRKNQNIKTSSIHCRKRELKIGCYLINLKFTNAPKTNVIASIPKYILLLGVFLLIVISIVFYKINTKTIPKDDNENYKPIGKYKFYPEQNKLIKEAEEISLSKKECELLSIFIANPNQIIKREELTKRVWEDNGVIVGRSLDTYISKLRKKLQEDPLIKLTNIHGVGYKIEL